MKDNELVIIAVCVVIAAVLVGILIGHLIQYCCGGSGIYNASFLFLPRVPSSISAGASC